jgi:hypothetical protein
MSKSEALAKYLEGIIELMSDEELKDHDGEFDENEMADRCQSLLGAMNSFKVARIHLVRGALKHLKNEDDVQMAWQAFAETITNIRQDWKKLLSNHYNIKFMYDEGSMNNWIMNYMSV